MLGATPTVVLPWEIAGSGLAGAPRGRRADSRYIEQASQWYAVHMLLCWSSCLFASALLVSYLQHSGSLPGPAVGCGIHIINIWRSWSFEGRRLVDLGGGRGTFRMVHSQVVLEGVVEGSLKARSLWLVVTAPEKCRPCAACGSLWQHAGSIWCQHLGCCLLDYKVCCMVLTGSGCCWVLSYALVRSPACNDGSEPRHRTASLLQLSTAQCYFAKDSGTASHQRSCTTGLKGAGPDVSFT